MTREEILAMKPGRKLDALIAEKVMGWHTFSPIDTTCDYSIGAGGYRRNFAYDPTDGEQRVIPLYSRDISAAWEVVEHFKSKWYLFSLKNLVGGNYEFTLTDWCGKCDIYSAQGDTPQEAICKAALYAVTHYA